MSSGFTFGFGGHGDYVHSSGSARSIYNSTAAGSVEGGVDNRVGIGRDARGPGGLRDSSGANDESLVGADIGGNMHIAGESSESHLQDVLLDIAGDDQIETSIVPESLSETPQVAQVVSSLTAPIDTRASPSEAAKEKEVKEVFHNLIFQKERPHGTAPVDSYNKPYDCTNFMPGGGTSAQDEASVFRSSPNWFFRTPIGVMAFTGNCKSEYTTHLREHAALMGTHSAVIYVDSKGQELCLGWVPVGMTVGLPPTYRHTLSKLTDASAGNRYWSLNVTEVLTDASPMEVLLLVHGLLKLRRETGIVVSSKQHTRVTFELNTAVLFKTSDFWSDAEQMPEYCIFPVWHAIATTSEAKFKKDKNSLLLGTFANFAEYYDNQSALIVPLGKPGVGDGDISIHQEVMKMGSPEERAVSCKANLRKLYKEISKWSADTIKPFFEQASLSDDKEGANNKPRQTLTEGTFSTKMFLHFNPGFKLLRAGTEFDPECRLAHVSPYIGYSLSTRMVDRDSSLSGVTHQVINPKQPQLDELWERWLHTQQDEPWQTAQLEVDWKRVRNASINHRPATRFLSTPYAYPKLKHETLAALLDPIEENEKIVAHQRSYNFWPSFGRSGNQDGPFQDDYYLIHKPYFRQSEGIFHHDYPLMPRTMGALQMDARMHLQVSRSPQHHFVAWLTGDLGSVLAMNYSTVFSLAGLSVPLDSYLRNGRHAVYRRLGMKKKCVQTQRSSQRTERWRGRTAVRRPVGPEAAAGRTEVVHQGERLEDRHEHLPLRGRGHPPTPELRAAWAQGCQNVQQSNDGHSGVCHLSGGADRRQQGLQHHGAQRRAVELLCLLPGQQGHVDHRVMQVRQPTTGRRRRCHLFQHGADE